MYLLQLIDYLEEAKLQGDGMASKKYTGWVLTPQPPTAKKIVFNKIIILYCKFWGHS